MCPWNCVYVAVCAEESDFLVCRTNYGNNTKEVCCVNEEFLVFAKISHVDSILVGFYP